MALKSTLICLLLLGAVLWMTLHPSRISVSPVNPALTGLYEEALQSYRRRQWQDAERLLSRYLKLTAQIENDPRNILHINGYFLMAATHYQLHRLPEAESEIRQVLSYDPQHAEALGLLAQIAYDEERLTESMEYLQLAQQQRESPPLPHFLWFHDKVAREIKEEAQFIQTESTHFRIKMDPDLDQSSVQELVAYLEDSFDHLMRDLGDLPRQPLSVIFYGADRFQEFLPGPEWRGAIFDGKIRIPLPEPVTSETQQKLHRTIRHELVHAFFYHAHFARGKNIPLWFNEGLAQVFAGEFGTDAWKALCVGTTPYLLSLQQMRSSFVELSENEAALAYRQSFLMVNLMIRQSGWEEIRSLNFVEETVMYNFKDELEKKCRTLEVK